MNKRLNVAVTGYTGTGSSAVIDFLREFDVCGVPFGEDKEYEHIPFYADSGLFDLGAILMNVNSPARSDTAISSFVNSMNWLNNNNFGWFGSYKWLVGDKFQKAVQEFIGEISQPIIGSTYSHYKSVRFSVLKVLLQLAAKIVYKRSFIRWGRKYVIDKKQNYFSMPTPTEFYSAARKFVNAYFEMCSEPGKQIMIYDHLLWPQQTHLINDYFDQNFKMIVVMRDVRDLYTLNKNYWYKPPVGTGTPLFPINPYEFVEYWKRVGELENKKNNSSGVLYIYFEDLVYDYDATALKIMEYLKLEPEQHINKKKYFNPAESIKNTQTFFVKKPWAQEAAIIGNRIPEYTYDFPFLINTSVSEMFDRPGMFNRHKTTSDFQEKEERIN
ncbi:hypothetical protein [Planomicrobium sp. CPCC 101110]|uniref:hypothetical protein n=1 Tax=Planomicrobium sp. CPCC 101110 TaxID=2599619 RepID=UPI0011B537C4|nr:hypothetical protein [Planomicrobium sp. CPCC 101110]TWT27781.1 hypothetical protein FQV30_04530 [Planomicrobium sp. CPCC 101110]